MKGARYTVEAPQIGGFHHLYVKQSLPHGPSMKSVSNMSMTCGEQIYFIVRYMSFFVFMSRPFLDRPATALLVIALLVPAS